MVCHFYSLSTAVFSSRQSLITNRYRFPSWLLPSWLIATPTNRYSPLAIHCLSHRRSIHRHKSNPAMKAEAANAEANQIGNPSSLAVMR
jgi:hypothetical protein